MRVLLICNYRPGVGGISGQVELLQKHLREDGHVADIFSTKGTFLWRLGLPHRLRKAAKDYDILHIHCCSGWGFLPAVVGITVGRRLKKRTVLTYHGGGAEEFFHKHPKLVRHYLTRTDQNIVLSGFLGKIFDRYNIPFSIIPNIIELDTALYRERNTIQPNFICTRAHEPLYNIPCIMRAFKQVQRKMPHATLTLVGDGSQHGTLVQMAKDMGLTNVTFTGRVDNKDIYQYLDKADILLSSPTVDNMPVSVLEAMNAGLLVISSRVGGIPYMIEDGRSGLLFDSDYATQLSERMHWATSSPTAIRIAHSGHASAQDYTWNKIKHNIYNTYAIPS